MEEKKSHLPLFALFRLSYRYGLPFVNIFFVFFIAAALLTSNSIFLVLCLIVFKYSIFSLPLDLELYV